MGAPSKAVTYDDTKNADINPPVQPEVEAPPQAPDTPGNDENADGAKAGQATADTPGDILGV